MAAQIRLKLNRQGVHEVLVSEGVQADLAARIERVATKAAGSSGLPVTSGVYATGVRARAYARYDDPAGGVHEANTGDLARSLDAAGGA